MSVSKTVKIKLSTKSKEPNWVLPDQVVSQDEIQAAIKDAEKGPFYTIQKSMEHFEQWLWNRCLPVR